MPRLTYDIDAVESESAVKEVRPNGEGKWRVVARAYGNCSLFGSIHRSDEIRLGNVSVDGSGNLILNVKER